MQPRNLIGLQWMEGIGDGTSGWTDALETEKGVVFIDLPVTITTEHDLAALNSGQPRSEQLCTEKVTFGLQKLWQTLGLAHP